MATPAFMRSSALSIHALLLCACLGFACPTPVVHAATEAELVQDIVASNSLLAGLLNQFVNRSTIAETLHKQWTRFHHAPAGINPHKNIYNIEYPENFHELSDEEQEDVALYLFEKRKSAMSMHTSRAIAIKLILSFLCSTVFSLFKIVCFFLAFKPFIARSIGSLYDDFERYRHGEKSPGPKQRIAGIASSITGSIRNIHLFFKEQGMLQSEDASTTIAILTSSVEAISSWMQGSKTVLLALPLVDVLGPGAGTFYMLHYPKKQAIDVLDDLWDIFVVILAYFGKVRCRDLTASLEKRYIAQRHLMDPALRNIIENRFYHIRSKGEEGLKSHNDFLRKAIALPTRIKRITYDEERIDKLFGHYPPFLQKLAKRIIFYLVIWSEAARKQRGSTTPMRKLSIILIGLPGTGKSEFVKRLAEAADLPLAFVQLGEEEGALFGKPDERPSAVSEALINTAGATGKGNYRNTILFFDEAGRSFNHKNRASFFLNLADPTTTTHHDRHFGADVHMPPLIICACNHGFDDKAIKDRFLKVSFPPVSPQRKQKILREKIIPDTLDQYKGVPWSVREEELTEEDYDNIKQRTKEQEAREGSQQRGTLRTAERVAKDYIEEKIRKKYLASNDEDALLFT